MPEPTAAPSKENPCLAWIAENRLLNGPGSAKETRHFVIRRRQGRLDYQTGDALGVLPANRPSDVRALLAASGLGGDEPVLLPRATAPMPVGSAFADRLALAGPTRRLLESLAGRVSEPDEKRRLSQLLDPAAKESLAAWLDEREIADVLLEFPSGRLGAQELVDLMRRLVPRLYSIASSPLVHPDEIHLTVAVVRYRTNGRDRVGVCSTFLADRAGVGTTPVPVFVSRSNFRLPQDDARDIIMVGPGTGIAPFRAFVQERKARGAKGRSWLFFGEQHSGCDFLYSQEWREHLASGALGRLDTAFSRDQAHKVYVQDRMREQAAELWHWIRSGASFYVCGDAKRMAKDVDLALHEIAELQGHMSKPEAAEYIKVMKLERRYQRDVY